jgi:CRP-like cAMP-binding protein
MWESSSVGWGDDGRGRRKPFLRVLEPDKKELLEGLDPENNLPYELKQRLAGEADTVMSSKHEVLIREGELNYYSYFLTRGRLLVFKRDCQNVQILITSVAGDEAEWRQLNALANEHGSLVRVLDKGVGLIGEDSTVKGEPAGATVVTATEAELLRLNPELTGIIYSCQLQRNRELLSYLKESYPRIFKKFSTVYIENTVKYMVRRSFPMGFIMLDEGQKTEVIYFLMRGSCVISRAGLHLSVVGPH